MLIVLHICSYPRRMIAATCVLVTLRLSYQTISPERCIVTYLWVNLIFNRIIHLIVRVLCSILSKLMKYSRRLLTLKGFSATSIFLGSARYLLVHLAEFSNHPRSVSLIPDRWKNYSQVSPRKTCENCSFSPVIQADLVKQGVFKKITTYNHYWYTLYIIDRKHILLDQKK